tara:strand:+ start:30 stop:461 length:432 start_codon:yes stop_codon:yes gene_type:complete
MGKIRVLFICIHNSARSQMAEALLNDIASDRFEVESAGIEPGKLNPLAVESMQEIGIDISNKTTKSVFDLHSHAKTYDYIITVCSQAQGQRCPNFPSPAKRLSWEFNDPSSFSGSWEDKLKATGKIRDSIKEKIKAFLLDQSN